MDLNENIDLEAKVVSKINNEFNNCENKLSECTNIKMKFEVEKKKIENSLIISDGDFTSKISIAIQHVHDAMEKIKKLSETQTALNNSVSSYEERVYKIKSLATDYIDKINALEKASDYLEIIKKVEEISQILENGVVDKNEQKQILNYLMLNEIYKSLNDTRCSHLYSFVNETLHYWHNVLKEKFIKEYEEIIKVLKWPFIGSVLTSIQASETLNRFQLLTEYLIQIQLNDEMMIPSGLPVEFENLSLPMVQLIKPLKKRFIYHFMSTKQTNRADKPEWYFTQILSWIRDHSDFIEKNVQPVYNKLGIKKISAKTEFMRGLVQMSVEKLCHELPQLYYDDSLFSHCIDEALGFDKEVKNSYGYPQSQPGVIEVLTQAQIFMKWINVEKKFTLEKMDVFLASETAFTTLPSGDVEGFKITECASSFITLLSILSERYEVLKQPGHKIQFLQLQLDLIDDFRVRLLQKLGEENSELLFSKFPNILNTVNYLINVLTEWGITTHFLHLQYYKSKLKGESDSTGTVFDECLSVLEKMRDDLMVELVDHVFMDLKAKSMPYRKDKWHAMESIKNYIQPTVSTTACPMFQVLISKLQNLQEFLAVSLFEICIQMLAHKIDQFLYEEIVSICIFNEGGASQFHYDITKNLFPLFGQYSKKPETDFKQLKDACVVLSMPKNVALPLIQRVKEKQESTLEANEILAQFEIYNLNKNDVLSILSRRTDLD